MNEDIIKKLDIIYKEYESLYINILNKNKIRINGEVTLLDYTELMKANFKEDMNLFNKVIYLFFDSKDLKIDILENLMEIYEKIKGKYDEK